MKASTVTKTKTNAVHCVRLIISAIVKMQTIRTGSLSVVKVMPAINSDLTVKLLLVRGSVSICI